jgi:hypothetical protein
MAALKGEDAIVANGAKSLSIEKHIGLTRNVLSQQHLVDIFDAPKWTERSMTRFAATTRAKAAGAASPTFSR